MSLHFSIYFSHSDPDPGGRMNVDPCGSGSAALIFNKRSINFLLGVEGHCRVDSLSLVSSWDDRCPPYW